MDTKNNLDAMDIPTCFTCADIPCEVSLPEAKIQFDKLKAKHEKALQAKTIVESNQMLFDGEDLSKINEYVEICDLQLIEQSKLISALTFKQSIAYAFAEQVNKRHEMVKQVRHLIGFEIFSEYFYEKQKRLASSCQEMIKDADFEDIKN